MRRAMTFLLVGIFGLGIVLQGPAASASDAGVGAGAQGPGKRITLEELYAPEASARTDFGFAPVQVGAWLDDEHYLQVEGDEFGSRPTTGHPARYLRVDAATGRSTEAIDADAIRAAFATLPGVAEADARSLAGQVTGPVARGEGLVLANHAGDLFLYDASAGTGRRLTFDPSDEVGEELSPDGRFVSFIRDHNIHLIEVETGRERALTDDGSSELLYGRLDWVYQEEIYGRGNFKGYWWSPDSTRLVLLRLDESPVKEFTVVDHIPDRLNTEVTNYPKAGDPNPVATLGVVDVVGGDIRWIDTSRYEPILNLIVSVGWTPSGDRVVFQVQDREQTWLDLDFADPTTGETSVLLHEESPAFVQVLGDPHWQPDGTFIWASERTGFRHLYQYALDESEGFSASKATLVRQLTGGQWEARTLYGVDAEHGVAYFSGTENDPVGGDVYRVSLAGDAPNAGLQRLSHREGTHRASFNPSLTWYVDTWSNATTPPQVTLHASDGALVRTIDDNADARDALAEYALGRVEFLQVPAEDGYPMEARILYPVDFDPDREYPVLQSNYGGPHAPSVRNSWGGTGFMWQQMLAQKGYIVWICDNRSASGKGIEPTWEAYGKMGVVELRDIEDGLDWLKAKPWVDGDRIGITGWSYGGFMASFALTHSDYFKVGIAGAPVTDWRLYDSIYTERYMKMPQNNLEGYDATSVVKAAADLYGKLLLIHGTMDDNVHMQNSIQLVYELEKAGKEFTFMVYPRSRHGVRESELRWHLQRLMTEFVLDEL